MKAENIGDMVELEAKNVIFYSMNDEQFFFEWLGRMEFVEDVVGRGSVIYIRINAREVTEDGLREILAFFQRYRIPMRQLRRFDREDFSGWFRRSNAYWYRRLFR